MRMQPSRSGAAVEVACVDPWECSAASRCSYRMSRTILSRALFERSSSRCRRRASNTLRLWHLFAYLPKATDQLARFTQEILRGPTPLSSGLRELIAAHTSKRMRGVDDKLNLMKIRTNGEAAPVMIKTGPPDDSGSGLVASGRLDRLRQSADRSRRKKRTLDRLTSLAALPYSRRTASCSTACAPKRQANAVFDRCCQPCRTYHRVRDQLEPGSSLWPSIRFSLRHTVSAHLWYGLSEPICGCWRALTRQPAWRRGLGLRG